MGAISVPNLFTHKLLKYKNYTERPTAQRCRFLDSYRADRQVRAEGPSTVPSIDSGQGLRASRELRAESEAISDLGLRISDFLCREPRTVNRPIGHWSLDDGLHGPRGIPEASGDGGDRLDRALVLGHGCIVCVYGCGCPIHPTLCPCEGGGSYPRIVDEL